MITYKDLFIKLNAELGLKQNILKNRIRCCTAPNIIIDDIKYIEVCKNCGVFKNILGQL